MGDHKEQPLRVGAAVRRRRRALDLTLAVVAERSGLSVPFLSQVENDRARPSRSSLEKVADALRTTAVELLAAADPACSVDVVRADTTELAPEPRTRSLVRGHHQMHASEFTGDHDAGREFQYRNDQLMYAADAGDIQPCGVAAPIRGADEGARGRDGHSLRQGRHQGDDAHQRPGRSRTASMCSATATTTTRVSGTVARQRWRTPPVR